MVANKYGIISHGSLIKEITDEELRNQCRPTTVIEAAEHQALWDLLSKDFPAEDLLHLARGVRITGAVELNALLARIIEAEISILSVNCYKTSIEDYYLSLLGGGRHA